MMRYLLACLLCVISLQGCDAQQATTSEPVSQAANSTAPASATTSGASAEEKEALRKEIYERARKRNGGKEPTNMQLLHELALKGLEKADATAKSFEQPLRIVPKGAKPEIIIKGDTFSYNGKPLLLGTSIKEWEKILGKPSRSNKEKLAAIFVWDELGIFVGTTPNAATNSITYISIYINKRPKDPYDGLVTERPDGTPIPPRQDYSPKQAFTGYLELDGFGIDAKTEFWEVRKASNPKRNLRCGLRDCSHPGGGPVGEEGNVLYLTLNRNDERGNIYDFTVSR